MNFYPSISRKLLKKALDFAATFVEISTGETVVSLELHTKQSLLYSAGKAWVKKDAPNSFDVTMGSFDGAESCELVGTYLLRQLPEDIRKKVGLYRDDGLGAFSETARRIECIKKQICKVFANNSLKIPIEANKIINFLDVTLDLSRERYQPYTKPKNTPLYIHRESNHPPSITKNIPSPRKRGSTKYPLTKNASTKPRPSTNVPLIEADTTTNSPTIQTPLNNAQRKSNGEETSLGTTRPIAKKLMLPSTWEKSF